MTVLLNSGTSELLIQPPKIIESDMNVVTGYMPFKGFKTFYRVVGEPSDKAPLVLLHGGPGSTHNYFEVLDPLAEMTHRQIIFYDQLGCGESYVEGHPELWTLDTWMEELDPIAPLPSCQSFPSPWTVVGRHACHCLRH